MSAFIYFILISTNTKKGSKKKLYSHQPTVQKIQFALLKLKNAFKQQFFMEE
jgi:hypothetical protein